MSRVLSGVILFLLAAVSHGGKAPDKPVNPFDYNYCGGERVYPVIGVNFTTACGPRNQIAVGRRGKLSWFYPPMHDTAKPKKGTFKLSEEQLTQISLAAEAFQIADYVPPQIGKVQYKLGLNFSGRPSRRVHTSLTETPTSSNHLVRLLMSMVPDQPLMPECDGYEVKIFDPVKTRIQRAARP